MTTSLDKIIRIQKDTIQLAIDHDNKNSKDNPFIMAANIPLRHITVLLAMMEKMELHIQDLEKRVCELELGEEL